MLPRESPLEQCGDQIVEQIRCPLMHGLPEQMFGSIEMRDSNSSRDMTPV
jgi:hypothetical protein